MESDHHPRNMESLYYTRICIIATLIVESKGYCLYGDGPDCAFPCHCAYKTECATGCLPTSQCATDPTDLDVPWQGPGCQIGNVALGKMANQTGDTGGDHVWTAAMGVDGQLPGNPSSVCTAQAVAKGQLAEWGVDLGDIYKISSVIIHNRPDCCGNRTTMFTIGIRNTSNHEELCYDDNSTFQPNDKISLTCNKPVIGRYIHFARKQGGFEPHTMNFCEFIAIGHRYFDCSVIPCEAGSTCNEVTGCERCSASHPPDCMTACAAGFYGVNCQSTCGNCAVDDVCNTTTGHCPNGCDLWWAGERCLDDIKSPVTAGEMISISNTQSSSLEVTWEPLSMVSSDLSQYYGYTVFYRESSKTNYTRGPDVPHSTNTQATITGLFYNTEYHIEIRPYREMMGQREYGGSYPEITHKTECDEPEKPQILSTMLLKDEGAGDYSLGIIFNPISQLSPRCDFMEKAWIQYKLQTDTLYTDIEIELDTTAYTIHDVPGGIYNIKITVSNNQGITASSLVDTITLGEQKNGEAGPDLTVIISSSVVAGTIALTVIVTTILVLKHRRMKSRDQMETLARSDRQPSLNSENPAPVTTDLTNAVPLDKTDYENIGGTGLDNRDGDRAPTDVVALDDLDYEVIGDTGQKNTGGDDGQDNRAVELDDAGYTHLTK